MTEATVTPDNADSGVNDNLPASEAEIDAAVAAFRRQLEGQVSVSATVVQDGLLDIWGLLPEGDSRSVVERWLTETLERNLYAVTDIDSRLDSVFSSQEG